MIYTLQSNIDAKPSECFNCKHNEFCYIEYHNELNLEKFQCNNCGAMLNVPSNYIIKEV
jgi:transcription elongation factor Elf1